MTLTPKEYLKVIQLFLPYFSNVTLQQDTSSKKIHIKTPKIDLEVSKNLQFVTFWSTPSAMYIKELIYVISFFLVVVCLLEQIWMILTFMYSTTIVSSKCVLSINLFLSMFFKDCLTIISIFHGLGRKYEITDSCPEVMYRVYALYSDSNFIKFTYDYDLFNTVSSSLYLNEYLSIFTYFIITILLSYVILSFSYILAVQKPETEKMSVYECGFEPYEDARQKFDVHFYLLAILFILFDIEAMFLIPWCVSLPFINYVGYLIMMEFILELCLGFLYIWYLGGLDW